ncbi:hypothetical protein GCM10027597_26030 [Saccharopolyspora tripterygii]
MLLPRIADVLGDRRITVVSGIVLTSGALVAAVGQSYLAMLVGCALLGFGSSAMLLTLGFLRRHLPGTAVSTAVSVLVMSSGAGIVGGMVGGGLTVKFLSLDAFFYILASVFALTTVALAVVIPSSEPASSSRVGVLGTLWMIGWVTLVLLALTEGVTWGWGAVALLLAGITAGVMWAVVERRSPEAVFDVKLLKRPYVTTACVSAGLFGAIDAGFLLAVTYYTQTPPEAGYGLGLDALGTGLVVVPFALMMWVGGKAAEKVIQSGRPGTVLVVGAVVCVVGLGLLAIAHQHLWQYLVGSALIGLGSRAGYSGAFAVPQLVVSEGEAGMAGGMAGTCMAIGYSFGAAVLTGLLTAQPDPITGLPAEHLYTVGFAVTAGFALLVVVAAAISRLRHRDALRERFRDA